MLQLNICMEACQEVILDYAILLSGFFTVIALIISTYQTFKHLLNYSNAFFQNKIMMILFMAPFYALTSFLTIVTRDSKGYFSLVRDIYEAVLIYAFFNLLSSYLAYDAESKSIDYDRIYNMLSNKGIQKHIWPMNYLMKDVKLISHVRGKWFFQTARLYILQYLAIKPTVTFILFIAYATDTWIFANVLKVLVFISVFMSVYFLVFFYQILRVELAYTKPLLKFISIKGVLFFTFWQDIAISIFKTPFLELFGNPDEERSELLIGVLGCLLVCFEMVILSITSCIAFSYKDFKEIEEIEKVGIRDLGHRLLISVVSDNFVTAVSDLRELGSPLKGPFKRFVQTEVRRESYASSLTEEGAQIEEIEKEYKTKIHETPNLITRFMENKEEEAQLKIDRFANAETSEGEQN